MIDYDNTFETMDIYCDNKDCNYEDNYDGYFQNCIEQAKHAGWKIIYNRGEYEHFCPCCSNEV